MLSKFRKLLRVLPNVFMVLGAVSVALAMLLSMVNLPVSADPSPDKHCPDGWIYKEEVGSGSNETPPDGLSIDINGTTVTFSKTVEFCVKASIDNSGIRTGDSYTVDFLNPGGEIPNISYVVIYKVVPTPTPPPPTVSLSKSANPTSLEGGGNFTFTLVITNTSDQDATITSLTDTYGLLGNCPALINSNLAAGNSTDCSYTINQTIIGSHTNNASVTLANINGGSTAYDSATITVTEAQQDPAPSVTLTKSANPTTYPEPGGVFTFTLLIQNNSAEAVTIDSLTDTYTLPVACTALVGSEIPGNGSKSCSYTVTETEVGSYTNTASVSVSNDGGTDSDTDTATVTVTDVQDPAPSVTLTKSASPTTYPEPGGVFTFTLLIQNNSAEAVTIDSLTDTYTLPVACTALVGSEIPGNGSKSCSYTVSKSEPGTYTNTASVTVSNDGGVDSDTDTATVTVTDVQVPAPLVTLTKSADPITLPEPGGLFTFTLLIQNDSDEEVTITDLDDDYPLSDECIDLIDTKISGGGSVSCEYTVTKEAAGIYDNTASVTVANEGGLASDEDSESVEVTKSQTTEVPRDPDPSETPEPTYEPDPQTTPGPSDDPNQPVPTLSQPNQPGTSTVLIPVTGIEFGNAFSKTGSVLFNAGLGLFGIGLVLQSIRRKIR